jgi:hypothetical protein
MSQIQMLSSKSATNEGRGIAGRRGLLVSAAAALTTTAWGAAGTVAKAQ